MTDFQENTVFSGNERVALKWIELPDELARWADQNQELIRRVQGALSDTYDTLTDEQLWEVIAATCSTEWLEARADLRTAELLWKDMTDPKKASLGAIGEALDCEENDAVKNQCAFSLAHFTVINEGLRQREDLSRLLSVLLVQKRMLERSAERTRNLQKATAGFASTAFGESARDKRQEMAARKKTAGIRGIFGMRSEKPSRPKKPQDAKNAPALSSPKT